VKRVVRHPRYRRAKQGASWLVWAVIAASMVIVLTAGAAAPHGWYDPACCDDTDCAPIPRSAVSATDNGWLVRLGANDHPMLSAPFVGVEHYGATRPSRDGGFHACILSLQSGPIMTCLYAPPMAF